MAIRGGHPSTMVHSEQILDCSLLGPERQKHMAKYKIINMVELDKYTRRRGEGEFYDFTTQIFVSL